MPDEGFATPSKEQIEDWSKKAASYGITTVSYK